MDNVIYMGVLEPGGHEYAYWRVHGKPKTWNGKDRPWKHPGKKKSSAAPKSDRERHASGIKSASEVKRVIAKDKRRW